MLASCLFGTAPVDPVAWSAVRGALPRRGRDCVPGAGVPSHQGGSPAGPASGVIRASPHDSAECPTFDRVWLLADRVGRSRRCMCPRARGRAPARPWRRREPSPFDDKGETRSVENWSESKGCGPARKACRPRKHAFRGGMLEAAGKSS